MAWKKTDDTYYGEIASAIRAKNGTNNTYQPSQMANAISALPDDSQFIDLCAGTNVNFSNDRITTYNSTVFKSNTNLISISLPNLTTLSKQEFCAWCTNLTSANLPKVTTFVQQEFYQCHNLTSVNLPELIYPGWQMTFLNCERLTEIYLPKVTYIGLLYFSGCRNLTKVILNKRATLANVNAFAENCPAIVYVLPEDLTWYSTATNWADLYADGRVKSTEELQEV